MMSVSQWVALGWLLALTTTVQAAGERVVDKPEFNIPRQRADMSLTQFAQQADITLIFSFELARLATANELVGRYDPKEAIARLLEGTGLRPTVSSDGYINIALDASPAPKGDVMTSEKEHRSLSSVAAGIAVATALGAAPITSGQTDRDEDRDARNTPNRMESLEEVIVTANRRTERLLEVPGSIAAYGESFIEQRSIDNINDLINITPNITTRTTEVFGEASTITIRGVSGSGLSTASTGIYLDDVPLTFGTGTFEPQIRTFDLERVEILRGPQGTLYGAGAMGGAVRYISNGPNLDEVEGQVRLDFGNTQDGDSSVAVDGTVSLPIVPERAAVRITASRVDRGGYIDYPNSADGNVQDGNDNELTSVRANLEFAATEDLNINLQVWHQESESNGLNIVRADSSSLLNNDAFTDELGSNTTDFDQFALVVDYDFGWANLVSSTSFFESDTDARFTVVAPSEFRGVVEGLTHESRMVSTSESARWQWVAGIFYQDGEQTRGFAVPAFGFERAGLEEREQLSIYGELTYAFSPALNGTLGLRHFTEDVSLFESSFAGGMARPALETTSDTNKTVPKVSLTYTGIEDMIVYASASQGFRVGGVNLQRVPGTMAPDRYESDELWSYEVGAKFSKFDRRFSGSVAVFHIDWDDIQSFTPEFGFPVVVNLGRAQITGIETELSYRMSDNWTFGFNGSLMKAESAEDLPAQGIEDGARLQRIPEGSAALFVNYTRQVVLAGKPWNFTAAVDGSFVGDQTRNNPMAPLFQEEFYTTNARVNLDSDSWEFALYARNLGSDDTVSFFGATDLNVRRPRTVGLEITSRF